MANLRLIERGRRAGFLRWPARPRGKQAVGAFTAALVLLALMIVLAAAGVAVGESGTPPIWILLPTLLAALAATLLALAGGVLAAVAIRHGDRSLLLFLPFLAMLIALFFLGGELLIGHD